jgi:hypothetical protein
VSLSNNKQREGDEIIFDHKKFAVSLYEKYTGNKTSLEITLLQDT